MRTPIYLALAAGLAACSPDFELQSQIARVRVLAVKAEPAELTLDPSFSTVPEPVTLTALAVAPEGRAVNVTYSLCRAGNVYAAEVECPGKDGVALPKGQLDLLDPAIRDALLEFASAGQGGSSEDPPDLSDPALRAQLEAGVPVFIGYEASDGSGTPEGVERGVRRLTVRLTDKPNLNPRVADVLLGDAPLSGTLPAGTEVTLRPRLAEGSAERFQGRDGEQTEQVFYSWFATGAGEVKEFRSLESVDGLPGDPTSKYLTPPAAQRVTFYVVARDGRGGVDWLERTVEVAP
ncbi:hypothetical protein P2318_04070 [Myxococcaceae bacterium GXIMD 01537]